MKLKEFIEKQGITITMFSKFADMKYSSVYKYCNGNRTPSLKVAQKIEKITKGQVTMKDLIPNDES